MPHVIRALIVDALGGGLLGGIFLAIAGYLDETGLAQSVFALPLPLFLAVLAGALLPFAAAFAATGLDWRCAVEEA